MLDLRFIRQNVDTVRKAIKAKNEKADIDKIIQFDEDKRKMQFEFDRMRAEQNRVSQEIPQLKKAGRDVSQLLADMSTIARKIKDISQDLLEISDRLNSELLKVPNIPAPDVPVGNSSENRLIREWGKPKHFPFTPRDHLELAEMNGFLDFKRAAKISGSGFSAYTDLGAKLERSLINFMIDFHVKNHGYREISLPVMVKREAMIGTGQLPKLEEDMYLIEADDLFLVPTAEVSMTNFHTGEIIPWQNLPLQYVSYSPCFRREAGSYGKETKGLQRLHQFNKVEMVRFVHPEKSYDILEEMVRDAEEIIRELGLHYRIMCLATGDLSFASAKTYDIEVWSPGSAKYLEVSSISNFESFQARRASLRFRDTDDKVKFLHTLNGSGVATPRTFIALLETWQNKDGSIDFPPCLQQYLN
ncbi:MAG: serine--tRNA ligase [Candidatus Cloacimonetes bacterium]|nr:serine--tRNA ligase [Candidatus Cloacimonadota bacterium]